GRVQRRIGKGSGTMMEERVDDCSRDREIQENSSIGGGSSLRNGGSLDRGLGEKRANLGAEISFGAGGSQLDYAVGVEDDVGGYGTDVKEVGDGVIGVANLDADHAVFRLIAFPGLFVAVVADSQQDEAVFVGLLGDGLDVVEIF